MRVAYIASLYFAVVNVVIAADSVIWRQEISCDPNSTCRPGAIAVDRADNKVVILGTSEQSGTGETNFWLWKIDPNGNVIHKKSLGLISKYNSLMVRSFGMRAIVKQNTGDIVKLNVDDVNSASLSITDRSIQTHTVKMGAEQNWSKGVLLHDMTSCPNGNLLFVGQEDLGGNGIIIKTDLVGNVVWKKTFDLGQTEIFSSVTCDPDGKDYYVVGLSASMAGKMTFAGPATVCVLRYDDNGELKASTYIEGGVAPWPTSFPKVIYLPSGFVLVSYDKSKNAKVTELYIKKYTRELDPLDEKLIMQTKESSPPAFYDICAIPENQFVIAGVINFKDLRIYECGADGTILQTLELDGEVRGGGVYVDYLAGKIFVAFAKLPKENENDVKIELLALKPYKTN